MQNTIILLIEQIVNALGTEFRVFLPQIVPQILRVFMHDTSKDRAVTAKVRSSLSYRDFILWFCPKGAVILVFSVWAKISLN